MSLDPTTLLGGVPQAARAKVASMLAPAAAEEARLREAAARVTTPTEIDRTLALARRLGGKGGAEALDAYLSHPFRVAWILLGLDPAPTAARFTIGALHNVYEVSGADEGSLAAEGISPEVTQAIRLLTIDRARENDVAYLADFYGAIESAGLALVRTADKLDNVLGLELLDEGPIKTSYIDLAEQFVGPMAARLSPALGAYFAEAIRFARETPCDKDKLARYNARLGGPA